MADCGSGNSRTILPPASADTQGGVTQNFCIFRFPAKVTDACVCKFFASGIGSQRFSGVSYVRHIGRHVEKGATQQNAERNEISVLSFHTGSRPPNSRVLHVHALPEVPGAGAVTFVVAALLQTPHPGVVLHLDLFRFRRGLLRPLLIASMEMNE